MSDKQCGFVTPNLPKPANETERAIAAKYIAMSEADDGMFRIYLVVMDRKIGICGNDTESKNQDLFTRQEADWVSWKLALAISAIIRSEVRVEFFGESIEAWRLECDV